MWEDQNPLNAYVKGKVVGKGSTSFVFEAVRKFDNEKVAIKETKMFELPEEKRERCLKEVQLLQSLHHPHIIALEDSFLTEQHLVLVLEHADGDLRQLIEKQRKAGFLLAERHIWGLFTQLTGSLRYMHGKRIMHRDLKPSNILNTLGGLKLGDLGLGRQFSSQTHEAFSKVGTPYYVSPEVVNGGGYDFKSDVWSMGCVLYELATLQNPFEFQGATLATVFQRIIKADYDNLEGSDHSEALKGLVGRMLSVNPVKRPGMVEVDDFACREFLKQMDVAMDLEDFSGGSASSSATPLEALAANIRPRFTGNRTSSLANSGEEEEDLTCGTLPHIPPNLPVIPEPDQYCEKPQHGPVQTLQPIERSLFPTRMGSTPHAQVSGIPTKVPTPTKLQPPRAPAPRESSSILDILCCFGSSNENNVAAVRT
mmetsp:Transcript_36337/g.50485  ORF Transcript_36337/g.50485 Transcript_36337/m.50485 type:complete len:425 (+) Transcript_36337:175-1449(+)